MKPSVVPSQKVPLISQKAVMITALLSSSISRTNDLSLKE